MEYRVRALDRTQQVLTLSVDALDEVDAREQTRQRDLTLLSIAPSARLFTRRAPRFALLLFLEELQALVGAGLSVIEALEALVEKGSRGDTRSVLQRLIGHLRAGMRLSQALQQQPTIFPPLLVGVIQAAEGASDLSGSLRRYLQYEKRIQAIKQTLISAAIYPGVLLSVGGLVTLFLLGYVVPRFAAIYQTGGRTLPFGSRLLLAWGGFVQQHASLLITVACIIGATLFFYVRRAIRTGTWTRLLRALPRLEERVQLFELSRLYMTLGMLLHGGLPVVQALHLGRSVMSPVRRADVDAARAAVEAGTPLSEAFTARTLATPIASRLIRVGEQSGQLGGMLSHAAAFYEEENSRWIERFTKSFEPLLMTAIGLVIGLIVVLLYLPIFDLAGSLQ